MPAYRLHRCLLPLAVVLVVMGGSCATSGPDDPMDAETGAAAPPSAGTSVPVATSSSPGSPSTPGMPQPTTAPTPTGAPPSQVPDSGLHATVTTSTLFDTIRAFQLELRNVSDRPIAVAGLQLDSPLYEQVDESTRDFRLDPGQQLVLPLPYGSAACGTTDRDRGVPTDGVSTDGEPGVVVVRVDDHAVPVAMDQHPDSLLRGRHGRECAVTAMQEAVSVRFVSGWTMTGPRRATGILEATPASDDATVEITDVAGNIIFGVTVAADLPVAGTAATPAAVELALSADRCDSHALIESKTTYVFDVTVALDDGEPVTVPIEVAGDVRATVQALMQGCLDEET